MVKRLCQCGSFLSKNSEKQHIKTKKHQDWLKRNEKTDDEKPKNIDVDIVREEIYIAKKTFPRNFTTTHGQSKKQEYLQIEEGVPAIVVKKTPEYIVLNSLTSSCDRNFSISFEELGKDFFPAIIENSQIVNCSNYPCHIPIGEFRERNEFDRMMSVIKNKFVKNIKSNRLKNFINDKIFQMVQSQGCVKTVTLKQFDDYRKNKMKLTKHKRVGDPIFNRNSRWCPPISEDYTYEEFEKSPSFPAPIGIRSKDFCLPSQLLKTIQELMRQTVCFQNVDEVYRNEFKTLFPDVRFGTHKCKYCGIAIDIAKYDSRYKSKENYIELCHRDPNFNYSSNNVYWGHGECNRKQGGYNEWSRVEDGFTIIKHNWYDFTSEQQSHIKAECKSIIDY